MVRVVGFAGFTTTPTTGVAPLTVGFTDASQGAVAQRVWNFGNGLTLANVLNPAQVFTNEGTYTVTLTVVSDKGVTNRASQAICASPSRPAAAAIAAASSFSIVL